MTDTSRRHVAGFTTESDLESVRAWRVLRKAITAPEESDANGTSRVAALVLSDERSLRHVIGDLPIQVRATPRFLSVRDQLGLAQQAALVAQRAGVDALGARIEHDVDALRSISRRAYESIDAAIDALLEGQRLLIDALDSVGEALPVAPSADGTIDLRDREIAPPTDALSAADDRLARLAERRTELLRRASELRAGQVVTPTPPVAAIEESTVVDEPPTELDETTGLDETTESDVATELDEITELVETTESEVATELDEITELVETTESVEATEPVETTESDVATLLDPEVAEPAVPVDGETVRTVDDPDLVDAGLVQEEPASLVLPPPVIPVEDDTLLDQDEYETHAWPTLVVGDVDEVTDAPSGADLVPIDPATEPDPWPVWSGGVIDLRNTESESPASTPPPVPPSFSVVVDPPPTIDAELVRGPTRKTTEEIAAEARQLIVRQQMREEFRVAESTGRAGRKMRRKQARSEWTSARTTTRRRRDRRRSQLAEERELLRVSREAHPTMKTGLPTWVGQLAYLLIVFTLLGLVAVGAWLLFAADPGLF